MARRAPAKAGAGTENRQVQQVRQAQAGKPDVGNRIPGVRLQTVPDELKYYTECHLCGFRKWCTYNENKKPICIACATYGVNPRFTKDKFR